MKRRGIAIVVSAPSGAGKSTLCAMLMREFSNIRFSVSCTTRARRDGEVDGKDYYFLDRNEFERRKMQGHFAEWAEVHGNLYGTPLAPVREMLSQGRDILFDVDVQGAAQIKLNLPASRFIFILPPDMKELERRLEQRGKDDRLSIERRLRNAVHEMRQAFWYDAIIVNDRLERAYDSLRSVYLTAGLAPELNKAILDRLIA